MSVDETGYDDEKPRKRIGIRSAVLASWEAPQAIGNISSMTRHPWPERRMYTLGLMLRYAAKFRMCSPRKQVNIVKVDELVDQWIEAVVGMCTCHDKDEYDAHDAKADELMAPILTAPVKQVREFYAKLLDKMKADKRVPLIVWMGFDAWGAVSIEGAPDQGIVRLKNKLAGEIAALVDTEDLRGQIPEAIKRALRWRDPETLQQVKETLESGVKPKLKGRQSCLFLCCGRGKKKVQIML